MTPNRITLCETCDASPKLGGKSISIDAILAALQDALAKANLDGQFEVTKTACMGVCEKPITLALQGESRATLVFADLDFPNDIDDVVATCRTYLNSQAGWIEDARPCGRLRLCLRSRVPAF